MKILPLILLFLCGIARADTLSGTVVGVSDGDTLTIVNDSKVQYKIRLAAIDAPEKAQAFGQQAKKQLSTICFNKQASIIVVDTDRYGRTVGLVGCEGTNANQEMVRSGFAWVYRKYAKGYDDLYTLEDAAKTERRGLWADKNPVPPWEWRKANR